MTSISQTKLEEKDGPLPRVAVCFFGIPRSLHITRPSLEKNVLNPIKEFAEVKVFAHFYNQTTISNPRTGEFGDVTQDDVICPDQTLITEEPGECLKVWDYEKLKTYGDFWSDDFNSLRNLIHQLNSIRAVSELSQSYHADCTIFIRPDLWYYDDLSPVVQKSLSLRESSVYLPYWQPFGGENDRFAVIGKNSTEAYANRIQKAVEFCENFKAPLHSETLLKYALKDQNVIHIPNRAARVRAGGKVVNESFNLKWVDDAHKRIITMRLPRSLSSPLHYGFKKIQSIRDWKDGLRPIPRSPNGDLQLKIPE